MSWRDKIQFAREFRRCSWNADMSKRRRRQDPWQRVGLGKFLKNCGGKLGHIGGRWQKIGKKAWKDGRKVCGNCRKRRKLRNICGKITNINSPIVVHSNTLNFKWAIVFPLASCCRSLTVEDSKNYVPIIWNTCAIVRMKHLNCSFAQLCKRMQWGGGPTPQKKQKRGHHNFTIFYLHFSAPNRLVWKAVAWLNTFLCAIVQPAPLCNCANCWCFSWGPNMSGVI